MNFGTYSWCQNGTKNIQIEIYLKKWYKQISEYICAAACSAVFCNSAFRHWFRWLSGCWFFCVLSRGKSKQGEYRAWCDEHVKISGWGRLWHSTEVFAWTSWYVRHNPALLWINHCHQDILIIMMTQFGNFWEHYVATLIVMVMSRLALNSLNH